MNKSITMDDGRTVTTTFRDKNTTVAQHPDGNVDVNATTPNNGFKDIDLSLLNTDVHVDENKTVVSGSSDNSNVTITLNNNAEQNTTVYGTDGFTTINTTGDTNTTTSTDGSRTQTKAYFEDKNITVAQTSAPSIEINTTTKGRGNIAIKLDTNGTVVDVDKDGKVVLTSTETNVTQTPNGDLNITSSGTNISIPASKNGTTVTKTSNGEVVIITKKEDNTTTQTVTDKDGTTKVITKDKDGKETSSSSYPKGSNITSNEDGL